MFERAFTAPLLRVLDARGRAEVRLSAKLRRVAVGEVVYAAGEPADTLFIVAVGAVTLAGAGSGERADASEWFGRDALVPAGRRSGRAEVCAPGALLEVSVASLRRALTRAGAAELLAREENAARRRAWTDLVRATPLGRELDARAFAELANALHEQSFARGTTWLNIDDSADFAWIIARGLVQLASPASHCASGDVVGLSAVLARQPHATSATALAEVTALRVPGAVLRAIARSHPAVVASLAEQTAARGERQRRLREASGRQATRHAFHELERLEGASSLLAIDLDACVRCNQCVAACAETHGVARFDREGEKVRLNLRAGDGRVQGRAVILPNACQHCHDPACLPECPTGAITRRADGAVLIRADLCTGCGACEKACPFDAVRMQPVHGAAGESRVAALEASKCDLCAAHSGPACVSVCPTGAVLRLLPQQDCAGIASGLGERAETLPAPARSWLRAYGWLFCVPPLLALARLGARPASGAFQLVTGSLAALCCLLLLAQAVLKRHTRWRAWLQRRLAFADPKRGLAPLVRLHAGIGGAALALVLAHAGLRMPHGAAGALSVLFWLTALSGVVGAVFYRVLPARLTRLTRREIALEAYPREREAHGQRFFDGISAQNAAVKELARRVLVPYAAAAWGGVALLLSGRTLAAEVLALERRVDRMLGGHQSPRLGEWRGLAETAVALRALAARRTLEVLLAIWLPCHLVTAAALLVLLVVHVLGVLA